MNHQEKVSRDRTDHSETVTQGKDSVQQGFALKSFSPPGSRPPIVDNRSGIIQRRQQEIMNNSPQVRQGAQVQHMIDNSPRKLAEKEKLENLFGNKRQTYPAKSLAAQELTPVLQRKQASFEHTAQTKGVNVNGSAEFEKEADVKGEKVGELQEAKTLSPEKNQTKTLNDGDEVDPGIIKTEDVKYELIAHGLAYQKTIPAFGNRLLRKWGYIGDWQGVIDDENSSFFAGLILSNENLNLPPIIAFKGTLEKKDFFADGDPYAVGYTTFMLNRSKILSQLLNHSKVAGKKVDVVGHSLGGALAKQCAVEFPARIGRVVTFQAPGIHPEQSEQFNKLKNKPSVTSHIAEGDMVDTAGRGQLQSEIYKHYLPKDSQSMHIAKSLPGIGSYARTYDKAKGCLTHFDYLLSSGMYAKQQKELLPEGWNMQDMINAVNAPEDKNKAHPYTSTQHPSYHKAYPHPYKSIAAEFGRETLGTLLRTQADVVCQAPVDQIQSMPLYGRINLVRNFLNYGHAENAQNAIIRIIFLSAEYMSIFSGIGILEIFNIMESIQNRRKLLDFLRKTDYYNKISLKEQINLLDKALYSGMLSGDEITVDLLIAIPGPHARALIALLGKKMLGRYLCRTDFNAGLDHILYELPEYNSIIKENFRYDE